ncbi:MAG: MTH938/NDUFAF3 family protein [Kangiellaceae bacterium]
MLLQKETPNDAVHIKAYTKGKIILNVGEKNTTVFLKENQLVNLTSITSFENINLALLDEISDNQPEVLIIGTGESHKIMSIDLIQYLNKKGIAVEAMASRQACHTYEVMAHDKRKVNALIFI